MNDMTLPSVQGAQLPRTYEAAKAALAECQNIDECKGWTDKALALASYAKQSQDETLLKMAARIKARAARRAGELLNQIEPGKTGPKLREGAHLQLSRTDAARAAGLSEHQQKTAQRVAAVPGDDFEAQVESDHPPTLTQLAQQGTAPRPVMDLQGRDPREFNRALHFVAAFERYAKEIAGKNVLAECEALIPGERERLRKAINAIDAIHDQIMTRI